MHPKLTPELVSLIEENEPFSWIVVTVQLEGELGEITDITLSKEEFNQVAQPVIDHVIASGGEVTNQAWINHTLRLRILSTDILTLADLDPVLSIDVAQMIGRDPVHEAGDGLLSDIQYMDRISALSAANMVRNWRKIPRQEFAELARNL